MSDYPPSLLTPSQREYLRGDKDPSNESQMRSRIRSRVYHTLRNDAGTLLKNISADDRRRIFRNWENHHYDNIPEGVDLSTQEGQFEKATLEINVRNLLTFIYLGVEETNLDDFEELLEEAIYFAAKRQGKYIQDFEFNVEFGERPTAEDIFNAVEEGEIGVGSLQTTQLHKLVQSESVDWRDLPDEQEARIEEFVNLGE